jgi:hypothetical protein
MKMHLVLAAAVAALATTSLAGRAEAGSSYPFCAVAGGYNSYENCTYPSFGACMAAVSGVGGHCQPNPRFDGYSRDDGSAYDDPPPRRRHRGYRPG